MQTLMDELALPSLLSLRRARARINLNVDPRAPRRVHSMERAARALPRLFRESSPSPFLQSSIAASHRRRLRVPFGREQQ